MSGPLSVPLPPSLRRRLERYAKQHQLKLATSVRTLVEQRLTEIEQGVSSDEEWQARQVLEALERIDREGPDDVSWEEMMAGLDAVIERVNRRKASARARRR